MALSRKSVGVEGVTTSSTSLNCEDLSREVTRHMILEMNHGLPNHCMEQFPQQVQHGTTKKLQSSIKFEELLQGAYTRAWQWRVGEGVLIRAVPGKPL